MRTDLESMFRAMAVLLENPPPSQDKTGDALVAMLTAVVRFDHCVVFGYQPGERPVHVYSTFTPEAYDIFVSQYLEGPYLLDPFYRNAMLRRDGVWRMREIAPDRFFSSEYVRSYYSKTRLAEEIGFFVTLDNGGTIVISLMRAKATGAFTVPEFALLKKAEPLVSATVRQFWTRAASVPAKAAWAGNALSHDPQTHEIWNRLKSSHRLTGREAAIIELVLQGHSSESIGLNLGISTGTVKVHRRNIYRKLGISSQTQLFSRYFPL
jgi:DNA-binding CsgD family transcriptional regulator